MYSVYILYSEKLGKFYTGYTSDFVNRLSFHNDTERNSIWTRKGVPWVEYFRITNLTESQATAIERHIKRMKSKKYIEDLAKYPEMVKLLKIRYHS